MISPIFTYGGTPKGGVHEVIQWGGGRMLRNPAEQGVKQDVFRMFSQDIHQDIHHTPLTLCIINAFNLHSRTCSHVPNSPIFQTIW